MEIYLKVTGGHECFHVLLIIFEFSRERSLALQVDTITNRNELQFGAIRQLYK